METRPRGAVWSVTVYWPAEQGPEGDVVCCADGAARRSLVSVGAAVHPDLITRPASLEEAWAWRTGWYGSDGTVADGRVPVACVAVSLVISSIFVLTPNVISHEGLLLVPVFLASGIMFTSTALPPALVAVSRLVPLSGSSAVLLGQSQWTFSSLSGSLLCMLARYLLASFLGRAALRRATVAGTLEVI